MRKIGRTLIATVLITILCIGCGQTTNKEQNIEGESILDPENPVTISIWHYYSGSQQDAFSSLVEDFNETAGKEQGIIVEPFNHGSVSELYENVLAAVGGKVGASEIPNIFAAYTDTAYEIDKKGIAVDLSGYLTTQEQEEYMDSYIEEGRFSSDNSLKIFPVAKSTEIFMINKTDWDKFAAAVDVQLDDCKTAEGVAAVAKQYYEWTDSLTPQLNDGKAFYGRDSMSNYFIIGSKQLGKEIYREVDGKIELDFDHDVIKTLWDNYYIPYIKGYFAADGRFRNDDIKTGSVIACTGSSSGATFFPAEVVVSDSQSYEIQMDVMAAPNFKDGEDYAVQQGAGMVVTTDKEEKVYASVQFLKWFTESKRNIGFSIDSGYLPVKKEANDLEKIAENSSKNAENTKLAVETAINTVNNSKLFTLKTFDHANDVRNILEYSLADKAEQDRKTVVENLNNGMELNAALANFLNDENYNKWYNETKLQLEETMKK